MMVVISDLRITHFSSIKLQASIMAQLTAATNQLTQKTQLLALTKCDQLAFGLKSMAKKVPFEDVKTVAADLAQCAANLHTASEQKERLKFDSNFQAANRISQERRFIVDEIYSRITDAAAIHLNLGQNVTVDHPAVFFSLERLSSSSISKKQLQSEDETLLLQVSHPAEFSPIDHFLSLKDDPRAVSSPR